MTVDTTVDKPRPPDRLGAAGRAIWSELTTAFEFAAHELIVVERIAATVDILADLDAVIAAGPTMVSTPSGKRVNPAVTEHRAQSIALARLVASLRLPTEEGEVPQRRTGARGVYSGADGGRGGGQVVRVSRWSRAAGR